MQIVSLKQGKRTIISNQTPDCSAWHEGINSYVQMEEANEGLEASRVSHSLARPQQLQLLAAATHGSFWLHGKRFHTPAVSMRALINAEPRQSARVIS